MFTGSSPWSGPHRADDVAGALDTESLKAATRCQSRIPPTVAMISSSRTASPRITLIDGPRRRATAALELPDAAAAAGRLGVRIDSLGPQLVLVGG